MKTWPTYLAVAILCSGFLLPAAAAEKRWKVSESEDEISGEKMTSLAVMSEEGSALVLTMRKGKGSYLTLLPAKGRVTIFPDTTDLPNKRMAVNITMRSTAMEKPHAASWTMTWMNYNQASTPVDDELARKVFSGDSVTFQFDKMGKRIKFATKGDGCEGLAEAVAKVLPVPAKEPVGAK
jgi:hypothetical protein